MTEQEEIAGRCFSLLKELYQGMTYCTHGASRDDWMRTNSAVASINLARLQGSKQGQELYGFICALPRVVAPPKTFKNSGYCRVMDSGKGLSISLRQHSSWPRALTTPQCLWVFKEVFEGRVEFHDYSSGSVNIKVSIASGASSLDKEALGTCHSIRERFSSYASMMLSLLDAHGIKNGYGTDITPVVDSSGQLFLQVNFGMKKGCPAPDAEALADKLRRAKAVQDIYSRTFIKGRGPEGTRTAALREWFGLVFSEEEDLPRMAADEDGRLQQLSLFLLEHGEEGREAVRKALGI